MTGIMEDDSWRCTSVGQCKVLSICTVLMRQSLADSQVEHIIEHLHA